jgi:hypothetical protein
MSTSHVPSCMNQVAHLCAQKFDGAKLSLEAEFGKMLLDELKIKYSRKVPLFLEYKMKPYHGIKLKAFVDPLRKVCNLPNFLYTFCIAGTCYSCCQHLLQLLPALATAIAETCYSCCRPLLHLCTACQYHIAGTCPGFGECQQEIQCH